MRKPVLVIMAAGMGSRYGGLKQLDPVDPEGHIIMDFSIYDAVQAGFEEVIFIIKRETEKEFREKIGDRIARHVRVHYVFQGINDLPEGFSVPEGRVKPWGTGHAVLSCIYQTEAPIAVINADDYYGKQAFSLIYQYLTTHQDDDETYRYMMVGYELGKTLTENGHVSRGICTMDDKGFLKGICERTHIEKRGDRAAYLEEDGMTYTELPADTTVSMNMWGFSNSILDELQARFPKFLEKGIAADPLKCEYFLPSVIEELLEEGKATVQVCKSPDQWYGVTYREDKLVVVEAVRRMKQEGLYPENFLN